MSVIITNTGNIGPFKSIETLSDRLRCDGTDYPFTVIGEYTISEDDGVIPISQAEIDNISMCMCDDIDKLCNEKLYTSVSAIFPSGPAIIQFRDEYDRQNLSDASTGALALVAAGNGTNLVVYRTEDNVNQSLTASQMVNIGLAVLGNKQGIKSYSWSLKDQTMAIINNPLLTTDEKKAALDLIDITQGWPS